MEMTPKENILAALRHEETEWVPNYMSDVMNRGFGFGQGPVFEKGPATGGLDGFGVNWVTPSSGGGAPIPEPGKFILDSDTICDWKKLVKFPDVMKFDWESHVKTEMARGGNRDLQALDFGSGNGPFERLAALMGFEEALMAMAVEPEAIGDLLSAIGDYKIQVFEMAKKYFNPDMITNYDDLATERSLFMSPEAYRKLIKPVHKKMYDAIRAMDMIPIQHTCGKAEMIVEDMIEIGVAGWTSVQPTNDIEGILKAHGNRICLIGGYDTNGLSGRSDASESVIRQEVKRDFECYGKYQGYIFFGFLVTDSSDPAERKKAMIPLVDQSVQCAEQTKKKGC